MRNIYLKNVPPQKTRGNYARVHTYRERDTSVCQIALRFYNLVRKRNDIFLKEKKKKRIYKKILLLYD